MRRRRGKLQFILIAIFVLAAILSGILIFMLPIPAKVKPLCFFLSVIAVSALGVFVTTRFLKR